MTGLQGRNPFDPHALKAEWSGGLPLEGELAVHRIKYPSGEHPDREPFLHLFRLVSTAFVQTHGATLAGRAVQFHLDHGHNFETQANLDRLLEAARQTWTFTLTAMTLHKMGFVTRDQNLPVTDGLVENTDIDQLIHDLQGDN